MSDQGMYSDQELDEKFDADAHISPDVGVDQRQQIGALWGLLRDASGAIKLILDDDNAFGRKAVDNLQQAAIDVVAGLAPAVADDGRGGVE